MNDISEAIWEEDGKDTPGSLAGGQRAQNQIPERREAALAAPEV
jgi:hypothetical protein